VTQHLACYLMEPRWLSSDPVFKVFILKEALCGIRLGGMLVSDGAFICVMRGVQSVPGLPGRVKYHKQRADRNRIEIEARYSAIDPMSEEFLAGDPANFRVVRPEVAAIEIRGKPTWWTGKLDSGSLNITFTNGSRKRYIIIDRQDQHRLVESLDWRGWPAYLRNGIAIMPK